MVYEFTVANVSDNETNQKLIKQYLQDDVYTLTMNRSRAPMSMANKKALS